MRPIALVLCAVLAATSAARADPGAAADAADKAPVVVELFTSQGCSSCPPADALLARLADRGDVLPLALHVDYWDYIGWTDTFGQARFTERQKAYARAAGHRTIYTPQMVIGGADHVVGFRPMEVADLIASHRAAPDRAQVRLRRTGDEMAVSLEPQPGLEGPLVVQLVRFVRHQTVEIEKGENAGQKIDYANIVTELTRIGDWDGRAPVEMTCPVPGEAAIAVIVQRDGMGPIVAAAVLP